MSQDVGPSWAQGGGDMMDSRMGGYNYGFLEGSLVAAVGVTGGNSSPGAVTGGSRRRHW